MASFALRLTEWQRAHGRHDLPWQGADAYRVWLSEIMLQQTQVATVIPYYQRFIASFPNIVTLAAATEEQVLAHWSGLGYYARGRNLHRSAKIIVEKYRGEFPQEFEAILALPGIGRSTAAAICALAYHQSHAILDGNVKRVLARHGGVEGWSGNKQVEAQLWQLAQARIPARDIAIYTQALMDIGATVCARGKPRCIVCPVQTDCVAHQTNRIAELPGARPRKAVPERNSTFLLLMHGNEILLEKLAPTGIWGGLWCLPQLDDGSAIVADYLLQNDMEVHERVELEEFTHTFTHFKLHITPVLLLLTRKPIRAQQAGSVWLEVAEALRAAIPTPVRRVLLTL